MTCRKGELAKQALVLLVAALSCASGAAAPSDADWDTEQEIFVPMRDGVHLSTDVMLPKARHGQLPTILVRTPYDKDDIDWAGFKDWYVSFIRHGYAFVFQNERGRYFSEGTYRHYLEGAATDGYDTIEWITHQPWSNGKVGTFGCSSSGEQQWPMANSKHPAHAAMIPGGAGTAIGSIPGNDTQGAVYRGGIPAIGPWAWWYHDMGTTERLLLPPNTTQAERIRLRNSFSLMPKTWFYTIEPGKLDLDTPKHDVASLLMQLPSKDVLRRLNGALTPFDEFITWTPGDPRWNEVPLARAGFSSRTPALYLDSWHDDGSGETARMFRFLQDQNTSGQYLVMGSGPHCAFLAKDEELRNMKMGDLELGDVQYRNQKDGYSQLVLNWFDHFLKGERNTIAEMPKVQLHIMGKGWIFADRWPLKNTQYVRYYFDRASTSAGASGLLSTQLPKGTEKDTYLYDPANPVPTRGGGCCSRDMAVDQRPVEARRDVLSYSTSALSQSLTIVGPIEVTLSVSSSAKDTDFIVKLVDVYPDGKAINLANDGFRVRYRQGYDKKSLMKPNEVYEIHLTNMVTGAYFPTGHRVRIDVTSSNFPDMERNLNTGGNNFDETAWVVAENSVHHSQAHPSSILLPILMD